MSLSDIFMPPILIPAERVRRVQPLGDMPPYRQPSAASIAANRTRRAAQKTKSGNRFQR